MNTATQHHKWPLHVEAHKEALAAKESLAARHCDAEEAYMAFRKTAPTRQITYTVEGFTNGPVTLDSYERTDTLDTHKAKRPSPDYADHPDFLTYVEEVALWEEGGADLRDALKATSEAWDDVISLVCSTWRILATFPVGNFRELHEKLQMCSTGDDLSEEEAALLLRHVAQDVARLSGCDVRIAA